MKMGERSHCCALTVVKCSLSLDQNCSLKSDRLLYRIPQILMFCILGYSTAVQMMPGTAASLFHQQTCKEGASLKTLQDFVIHSEYFLYK